jgi:hypothetical protein
MDITDKWLTMDELAGYIKMSRTKLYGIEQLKSYMNAKGSPVAVWSNGSDSVILYRPSPKEFDDTLFDIPRRGQQLQITQHVYHQNCT